MTFDIEAGWMLNLLCNYECAYCFSRSSREHSLVGRISPEQYLEFFDSTGKIWMLHLSGGEPFLHPDFIGLCKVLTSRHYISVNSNLSSRRVQEFAESVDPSRVQYVHCGVHLEERDRLKGWRDLVARIRFLVEHGMATFASLVMTPQAFADWPRVADLFSTIDVPLIPKAIRGNFEGRWYPQAYTDPERMQFRRFSEQAEHAVRTSRWKPFRYRPTVNPLLDRSYLDGFPDFDGISCSAGRLFVSIGYDGKIFRCGKNTVIGDIFRRRLDLYAEDRPCDDEYCPYWCLRYSDFEDDAPASYPRRESPSALKQTLIAIRGVRREVGNRITGISQPERSRAGTPIGSSLR